MHLRNYGKEIKDTFGFEQPQLQMNIVDHTEARAEAQRSARVLGNNWVLCFYGKETDFAVKRSILFRYVSNWMFIWPWSSPSHAKTWNERETLGLKTEI